MPVKRKKKTLKLWRDHEIVQIFYHEVMVGSVVGGCMPSGRQLIQTLSPTQTTTLNPCFPDIHVNEIGLGLQMNMIFIKFYFKLFFDCFILLILKINFNIFLNKYIF